MSSPTQIAEPAREPVVSSTGQLRERRSVAIESAHGRLPRPDFAELWAYRELARALAARDLKLRYKQTVLGAAWAVIQPVTAALIFAAVFGRLAHLPSEGVPYIVFVYAALCVWAYVSSSVEAAAESLVENNKLVTTIYFPRLLAPVAAVLPGLVDFAVSLGILAGLMAIYGVTPSWQLLAFPFCVVGAVGLSLGVGAWLSALNVLYRDVRYTFGFLLQLWLFASPVVYAASLVQGDWRYLFAANPLVGLLNSFRWSLFGTPLSAADAVSLATGALVLATGVLYFTRVERELADRI